MTTLHDILKKLPDMKATTAHTGDSEVMESANYLRQSSKLINEALKKGFDVLQLDNGDIVTTGTKVVVSRYRWDEKKGKMVKSPLKDKKSND